MSAAALLDDGLRKLGLDPDPAMRAKLVGFLALLQKWNRIHNLTAVRDPVKMVSHHLLDCLAVIEQVHGPRVADVGSGGGFPGVPFAIVRPNWQLTLIESQQKKCAFLRQAAIELELGNVDVFAGRVEQFRPARQFDTVISRAFAELAEYVSVAGHLVGPSGIILAMKGVYPHEELSQVPDGFALADVTEVVVPGLAARRHLIALVRN